MAGYGGNSLRAVSGPALHPFVWFVPFGQKIEGPKYRHRQKGQDADSVNVPINMTTERASGELAVHMTTPSRNSPAATTSIKVIKLKKHKYPIR